MVKKVVSCVGRHIKKKILFRNYIDYVVENERYPDEYPFYLKSSFSPLAEMYDQYEIPKYFKCQFDNFKNSDKLEALSRVHLEPKYLIAGLNRNFANSGAWDLLISGKRIWIFYKDNQSDLFRVDSLNPFRPGFETFVDQINTESLVCLQHPGDIVFMPSNWWYSTLRLEMGISLSEFFINKYNITAVLSYCEKHNIDLSDFY